MMPTKFSTKAVGLTFVKDDDGHDLYPDNLHRVDELNTDRNQVEMMTAVLIRNPDNPHDANAIEVHVPALGDNGMIGHLNKNVAKRLAPELDSGEKNWRAGVQSVNIMPGQEHQPGITIRIEATDKPNVDAEGEVREL